MKKNAPSMFLLSFSFLFLFVFLSGCIKAFMPVSTLESDQDFSPYVLCVPLTSERQSAVVSRVIDGDSIEILRDGVQYQVRYIGIDAPEYGVGADGLAEMSRQFNQDLVGEKKVALFRDVSDKDRFGRLLRYVFVEDLFVNQEMVRQGFAESKAYPPDLACQNVISKNN